MKKIISLFQRNYDGDRLVRNEIVEGAEWVVAGEGFATRKYDGTCCLVHEGRLFKRYEVKKGKKPPHNFKPANDVDQTTGKQQGWVPVGDGPEDEWHREAFTKAIDETNGSLADGTFELCGPKIQGNPEQLPKHWLIRHGNYFLADAPRDFESLKKYLSENDIEGIVWHHDDGRMVKIKSKDFGIKRTKILKGRLYKLATAVSGGERPGATLIRLAGLLVTVRPDEHRAGVEDWKDWLRDFGGQMNDSV